MAAKKYFCWPFQAMLQVLQVRLVAQKRFAVAGRHDVGFMLKNRLDRFHVAVILHPIAKDQVVAKQAVGAPRGEKSVAGKSHARAIDSGEHRHLVFRMAGRMENLKLIFLPLEGLAVMERPVDLDGFTQDASQVVATGVLEDIHHVFVAPHLGAVMAHEMGEAVQMVVVHVAGHDDVHGFQPELRLELGNGVLNKAHAVVDGGAILVDAEDIPAGRTVIHKERLAAVTDQRVKARGGLVRSHQMGRNRVGFVIHGQGCARSVRRIPTFQLVNEVGNPGVGLVEGFAVGRADQLRPLFANPRQRKDGAVNSIGAPVLVLKFVEVHHLPRRVNQVTREGHLLSVHNSHQADGAQRVAG